MVELDSKNPYNSSDASALKDFQKQTENHRTLNKIENQNDKKNTNSSPTSTLQLEVVDCQSLLNEDNLDNYDQLFESIGNSIFDEDHLVVLPTETVYGLGGNALNKDSVLRIFEAKQRPLNDPLICHVSCKNFCFTAEVFK